MLFNPGDMSLPASIRYQVNTRFEYIPMTNKCTQNFTLHKPEMCPAICSHLQFAEKTEEFATLD